MDTLSQINQEEENRSQHSHTQTDTSLHNYSTTNRSRNNDLNHLQLRKDGRRSPTRQPPTTIASLTKKVHDLFGTLTYSEVGLANCLERSLRLLESHQKQQSSNYIDNINENQQNNLTPSHNSNNINISNNFHSDSRSTCSIWDNGSDNNQQSNDDHNTSNQHSDSSPDGSSWDSNSDNSNSNDDDNSSYNSDYSPASSGGNSTPDNENEDSNSETNSEDDNSEKSKENRTFTVLQWNLNSYWNKYESLKLLIEKWQPNVICLQETRLKPEHKPKLKNFSGYFDSRQTELTKQGTAVFVSEGVKSEEVAIDTPLNAVAVKILRSINHNTRYRNRMGVVCLSRFTR
jgi:hypothetical protein